MKNIGSNRWIATALAIMGVAVVGCSGDEGSGGTGIDPGTTTDGGPKPSPTTTATTPPPPPPPVTDAGGDAAPAGPPKAVFATAAIDLGNGDCGGTAVTKTASFQNTGGQALTVNLATSGAPFTIAPTTLTIAPGGTGTATLSVAVPAAATAGAKISGSVTVTTNDPALKSATVPVSITPQGATLAFTGATTSASFGTVKLGQAATPIGMTLKNTGNRPATVAFGAPSDAQFSLSTTPSSPATVAANGTVALSAGFKPNKLTASTGTSTLTVTGAVCGTSVKSVDFSGQGAIGNVTGWPTAALDFGANPCGGSAAAAQSFTLTNSGAAPVNLTGVSFANNKGYTASVAAGATVPAATGTTPGTLVVTVTPPAIPQVSSIPGNYGDTLTITTDLQGDTPHAISVGQIARGAILAFDTSLTANFGAFGDVPVGTTANHPFNVVNTGSDPANVTVGAATPFSVSVVTVNVPAGGSAGSAATFAPITPAAATGSLTMTATGICQPLPDAISLSGTGKNGGISLSAQALNFSANCGTTAAPATFTITNSGNLPMTWNATIGQGQGTLYTFSPTTETLQPGASSTVTVTPAAIPQHPANVAPSAFTDAITITTDIVGDAAHTVTLNETPLGAVLSLAPTGLAFGNIPVNSSSPSQSFEIINSGNAGSAPANVSLVMGGTNPGSFAATPTSAAVAVGTPSSVGVVFSPGASATNQGATIGLSTTDALCAPLPAALTAVGTGTLAQVSLNPPVVNFGNVNCGSTASAQTIVFTNPGNQDYSITSSALKNNTYYTVTMDPPSGVVPANNGGAVTFTVTPKPIPAQVPVVPDLPTFSDELTITTDAQGDTPHKIPLNMGAQGVILRNIASKSWSFGTVNVGATGYYNASLRNDGNVPVTMSMSGATFNEFRFPQKTLNPGNNVVTGQFTPSAAQAYADTATLVIPQDTVLCQPLPNYDLTLAGTGATGATVTIAGNLAFPAVNCGGSAASPQSIYITNSGNAPLNYTTAFDYGAYYSVSGGGSGTVAPNGGTAQITVSPAAIATSPSTQSGSAPYTDRLIVSMGGQTYAVPISMTARGAELDWTDNAPNGNYYYYYAYSTQGYYGQYTAYNSYLSVKNVGNLGVTVTPTFDSNPGLWSMNPNGGTAPANATWTGQLWYTGTIYYETQSNISFTASGGPVCRPLQGTRLVRGYYWN